MKFAQNDLSNQSRRFPGWLASVLIFVSLLAMFYSGLVAHVQNATNPWVFNDDTRSHIPPLLRYTAAQTFKGDYLAEYHVALMPVLFRSGYAFAAKLGFDPRVIAKVLPYPMFLVTLIAIGLTAWRLGGPVAAWGSAALCLGAEIFLYRITGGLARGFAFPLLALALASLVYGRPDWLAVITIAAAALYPPVSIVIGMTLLGMLMLPTEWPNGVEKWLNPRRLAVLAITALLSVSVVMPTFIRLRSYGPLLKQKDLATYPETGRGGRYSIEDIITSPSLFKKPGYALGTGLWGRYGWDRAAMRGWGEAAEFVAAFMVALAVAGTPYLIAMAPAASARLFLVPLMAIISYSLSYLFYPYLYLPQRHLAYSLPLFAVILVPAAMKSFPGYFKGLLGRRTELFGGVLTILFCVLTVEVFGLRDFGDVGYTVQIEDSNQQKLLAFVSTLPESTLLAGWPLGLMENIPLVCAKRVLLNFEMHLVFHRDYAKEMRERADAIIKAYFSPKSDALEELHRRWGVTHLLIDRQHYQSMPRYFEPFNSWIREAMSDLGSRKSAALTVPTSAIAYDDGQYQVIMLNCLRAELVPSRETGSPMLVVNEEGSRSAPGGREASPATGIPSFVGCVGFSS